MSNLTILLLTYNRLEYAKKTLWSTLNNIHTEHELRLHIASDGDNNDYIAELLSVASNFLSLDFISTSNSHRGGYGANYNLATQIVHSTSSYVLPLEDDWELIRPLEIDSLIAALDVFNCIRLGYIGFTQTLRGEFVYVNGSHYLLLDPNSPEPHVFAGHPRIETVRFEREVGEWPTGLLPGETEFVVAHKPEARQGIAWPIDLVRPCGDLFAHIGTLRSY